MSLLPPNPRSDDADFGITMEAMTNRQSSINPEDRCTICDGMGLIPRKMSGTYVEYVPCIACGGSGKRNKKNSAM